MSDAAKSIQLPLSAPQGWLNTPEGSELLQRRAAAFGVMGSRYAKTQLKVKGPKNE